LEQRIISYRRVGVSRSRYSQEAELNDIRAEMPEYAAIHSLPLVHLQGGRQPGTLDNGVLVLSKVGRIAVRWSRLVKGTIKSVTISRESDGWFARLCCVDAPVQQLPATGEQTGIDLGFEAFATRSDGTRIFHLGWYLRAERALNTAQRRVSRRTKGSNRRRKAVALLAKAHQTVRRQRQDYHRKTALELMRANDVIYHEDLHTASMVRNHHLAKSIQDAGRAAFLGILFFKAVCAGRRVIAVPPAYTGQRCSGCGALVQKGLSARWRSCPACGASLHRDHNAAKHRERLGQSLRGGAGVPASENRASIGLLPAWSVKKDNVIPN
jgi:putative transposase